MTVLIPKFNLLVATSPKSACSSIKTALFYLENGFGFQDYFVGGQHIHIHHMNVYPAIDFRSVERKILDNCLDISVLKKACVVRDPVSRFLSAYSNRVVFFRDMERELASNPAMRAAFNERNLSAVPDLDSFIRNLAHYRALSPNIWLHTERQIYFLGPHEHFYDAIFNIKQMDLFENFIRDQSGVEIHVPHMQAGGDKIDKDVLTQEHLDILYALYREDFEIYGQYF